MKIKTKPPDLARRCTCPQIKPQIPEYIEIFQKMKIYLEIRKVSLVAQILSARVTTIPIFVVGGIGVNGNM